MQKQINPNLTSWASESPPPDALEQALRMSRLPILAGPVCLMADAELGLGATVGYRLCGDQARFLLFGSRGRHWLRHGARLRPPEAPASCRMTSGSCTACCGTGSRPVSARGTSVPRTTSCRRSRPWACRRVPLTELTERQTATIAAQFGSLGSGNHFVEVCLDELDRVWIVLQLGEPGHRQPAGHGPHQEGSPGRPGRGSGPRGPLTWPWLAEGAPGVRRLRGGHAVGPALRLGNRGADDGRCAEGVACGAPTALETKRINRHHNYAAKETLTGAQEVWITRKGAVPGRRSGHGRHSGVDGRVVVYCSCTKGSDVSGPSPARTVRPGASVARRRSAS